MSDPPLQRIEVLKESESNRKSKSLLQNQRNSSLGLYSIRSPSPLRNIRRRSLKYESLGSQSNRSSLSNTEFSPQARDDHKENSSPQSSNRDNIEPFSPATMASDVPVHPLQYSSKSLLRTPSSDKSSNSVGTPSSILGPSNLPKSASPKPTRLGSNSPKNNFLRSSLSKLKTFSNRKLNQTMSSTSNSANSPVPPSLQTSQHMDRSRHLNNIVASATSDSLPRINSDSSYIFSYNSNVVDNNSTNNQSTKHRNNNDNFHPIMTYNRSGNELHNVCGSMTSMNDLVKAQSLLAGIPLLRASERDYKGETILHSFSNNKVLAAIIGNPNNEDFETKNFLTPYRQPSFDENSTDQLNQAIERFLVDNLLPSFFGAPIAQDGEGQIPFEAGLIDWVSTCHREMYGVSQSDPGFISAYTHKVSDAVTLAWESTANVLLRSGTKSNRQSAIPSDLERGESMSSAGSTNSLSIGKSKFTPHARFCIRMLSLILDEFEKFTEGFKTIDMNQRMDKHNRAIKGIQQLENVHGPLDLCGRVAEKIASIPNLLEVIFSINNEVDLEYVLSTKIIRKVMVDKHSVGPWLTSMLQSPHAHTSKRAIQYIHTVSRFCSECQGDHEKDKDGTEESKKESGQYEDLVDEVSRLHDFIPSLLALDDKVIEEVSTSLMVKEVMDIMIAQPFVATVVFCDAIFLCLMIVGFREAVKGMILGKLQDNVLKWIYVVSFSSIINYRTFDFMNNAPHHILLEQANSGIFYFIIAEIGKFVSLFLLSKQSRNYILSFWNLIDLLAIMLAALSSVTMRWHFTIGDEAAIKDDVYVRGLLAVTTGFLWLRVLNFLKAINMQLATFVLAILQITKDIFWFCIILLALVVSFSQMFFTLMAPPTCATGELSGRQCEQSEYLLGVYTILLGDFGVFTREDFPTAISVFMVVFYSFLVTVVLLNVLIAVASDSYEKCLLKSQKLFGRARVMLIAELASFQSLLRRCDQDAKSQDQSSPKDIVYSKWWSSTGLNHNWSRGSVLFFWLSGVVTVCRAQRTNIWY